jgi:hypothetical protein
MAQYFDDVNCTWNGKINDCHHVGTSLKLNYNDSMFSDGSTRASNDHRWMYSDDNFDRQYSIVRGIVITGSVLVLLCVVLAVVGSCLARDDDEDEWNRGTDRITNVNQLPAYSPEMLNTCPSHNVRTSNRNESVTNTSFEESSRASGQIQRLPAMPESVVFATDVVFVESRPAATAPPSTFINNESELDIDVETKSSFINGADMQEYEF